MPLADPELVARQGQRQRRHSSEAISQKDLEGAYSPGYVVTLFLEGLEEKIIRAFELRDSEVVGGVVPVPALGAQAAPRAVSCRPRLRCRHGNRSASGRLECRTHKSRWVSYCCRVTISSRTAEVVQQALQRLKEYSERVHGQPCDVSDVTQIEALWRAAAARWGRVDIWINNAGLPQRYLPVWELSAEEAIRLVQTNLLGMVHGSRVAMREMQTQGGGAIYNIEGWGSNGQRRNGLTLYGTTKRAVRYFTQGLADEAGGGAVLVGTLSPGMMVTDFLLDPMRRMAAGEDPVQAEQMRRVVNILGDRPETVARYLAVRILSNRRQRAYFAWLTGAKVLGRFLTASLKRRDLFTDQPGSRPLGAPGQRRCCHPAGSDARSWPTGSA